MGLPAMAQRFYYCLSQTGTKLRSPDICENPYPSRFITNDIPYMISNKIPKKQRKRYVKFVEKQNQRLKNVQYTYAGNGRPPKDFQGIYVDKINNKVYPRHAGIAIPASFKLVDGVILITRWNIFTSPIGKYNSKGLYPYRILNQKEFNMNTFHEQTHGASVDHNKIPGSYMFSCSLCHDALPSWKGSVLDSDIVMLDSIYE